jgi:CPA1 family monovalent cation:H+ antiporter
VVLILAMLLAVVASGFLMRVLPFAVPLPLLQIGLGAMITGALGQGVTLDPEVFFVLFLPPLLFLDGWRIPNLGLLRDKATILELALGLVAFTVLGIGLLIHAMIPAMPLAVAFALAAILSPTDPVAVSSIALRTPIPRRLLHILQGEALLNDASGLVCFTFAVGVAMTGVFSPASALAAFLWAIAAGVGCGVALTLAVTSLQMALSGRYGEEAGSPILVSILLPFGAYLLADTVGASGILAAVAAGIAMSYVELTGRAPATTRVDRAAVWNAMQFALNGVVFVLLGEQMPGLLEGAVTAVREGGHGNPWWLAGYALAISLGLAVLRFAWVWTSLRLTMYAARRRGEAATTPPWRLVAAMSLAGVRGAITLAGVMTLPLLLPNGSPFPARELAVFLAASVILLSLVAASVGLPALLRGLALPTDSTSRQQEEAARSEASTAAIVAIESALRAVPRDAPDVDAYAIAAASLIERYRKRLELAGPGGAAGGRKRQGERAEKALLMAGLHAEREAVFDLARQSRISDEASRKLVREIDLVEARYR